MGWSSGQVLVSVCVLVLLAVRWPSVNGVPSANRPDPSQFAGDATGPNVDPEKFLEKFGYLPIPSANVQHSPQARQEAIRSFQRMTGLPVTGSMDETTLDKMASPRCGLPDVVAQGSRIPDGVMMEPSGSSRTPEAFNVPGYKWTKNELTWRATNYSPDLSQGSQRRAFSEAFGLWRAETPLEFREISGGTPDIEIKFGHGDHGDGGGNSFDNQGGVLAHAYYPEDGDTHFDEAEHWTEYTEEGTNLMIVAAHEFGHALGLGHSQEPEALMAPYYNGYVPNFKLSQDDISAIQSLYGRRQPVQPATARPDPATTTRAPSGPSTTRSPDRKPLSCDSKFDAVMQGHDSYVYAFKYKWVWRLDEYYGVLDGFPKLARKVFDRPPLNIGGAVYSWMTRYTYFFKARRVFKYYGFERVGMKEITNPNWPSSINSVFMGRDGRIYILSGSEYHIFDEYQMDLSRTASTGYISNQFPGVPNNVEAAVRLRDGFIYFFKGKKYRKYDEYYRRVVPGYPKEIYPAWMGSVCGGNNEPK